MNAIGMTGNTTVRIDDGTFMSLSDLSLQRVEEHVITCDQNGQFNASHAVNPSNVGTTDTVYVVTVQDNALRCSPGVLMMLADRTYKAVEDLAVGDTLLLYPRGVYTLQIAPDAVTLRAPMDVYDMSVPGVANYALAAGPFVKSQQAVWNAPRGHLQ